MLAHGPSVMFNNMWGWGCLVGWPKNLLQGVWEIMTLPVPSTLHLASLLQTKHKHQNSHNVCTFLSEKVRKVSLNYLATPDFWFPSYSKKLCGALTDSDLQKEGGLHMNYPSFLTLFRFPRFPHLSSYSSFF